MDKSMQNGADQAFDAGFEVNDPTQTALQFG